MPAKLTTSQRWIYGVGGLLLIVGGLELFKYVAPAVAAALADLKAPYFVGVWIAYLIFSVGAESLNEGIKGRRKGWLPDE